MNVAQSEPKSLIPKWHISNRYKWHRYTEIGGTIQTIISNVYGYYENDILGLKKVIDRNVEIRSL